MGSPENIASLLPHMPHVHARRGTVGTVPTSGWAARAHRWWKVVRTWELKWEPSSMMAWKAPPEMVSHEASVVAFAWLPTRGLIRCLASACIPSGIVRCGVVGSA